jgi:hypothetical protein
LTAAWKSAGKHNSLVRFIKTWHDLADEGAPFRYCLDRRRVIFFGNACVLRPVNLSAEGAGIYPRRGVTLHDVSDTTIAFAKTQRFD